MKLKEVLSIIGMSVGIVVLLIGLLRQWWNWSEINTSMVATIITSIIVLFAWGFRSRFEKSKDSTAAPTPSVTSKNSIDMNATDPLYGEPYRIEKGIRYYALRTKLPKIDFVLSLDSIESIGFLNVTSYLLMLDHWVSIESAANRGIKIAILILDSTDNKSVNAQKEIYEKDIKQELGTAINELCKIKTRLSQDKKQNLMIYTYRGVIRHGIMIIKFKRGNNPWVRIERFTVRQDANTRTSDAAYYKDNTKFFEQYSHEYESYLHNPTTKEVSCRAEK